MNTFVYRCTSQQELGHPGHVGTYARNEMLLRVQISVLETADHLRNGIFDLDGILKLWCLIDT